MGLVPPPPETLLPLDRSALAPGLRLAVAVSGGADSTALLRVLHACNALPREPLGLGLSAIHVHHGIVAKRRIATRRPWSNFVQGSAFRFRSTRSIPSDTPLCLTKHWKKRLERCDTPLSGKQLPRARRTPLQRRTRQMIKPRRS